MDLAARPAVSRRVVPIALACAIAIAGFVPSAHATAAITAASAHRASSLRDGGAGAEGSGATVALEEQSLPPEIPIPGSISGRVIRIALRLGEPGRRG